jgi:hypothetical protein
MTLVTGSGRNLAVDCRNVARAQRDPDLLAPADRQQGMGEKYMLRHLFHRCCLLQADINV